MEGSCHLSAHDEATLDRVFNPHMVRDISAENGELLAEEEKEVSETDLEAKRLELEGVKAAENGDVETSLQFFNQALDVAPNRASIYNNRAQALQLKGQKQDALEDLNKAIELSSGRGKVACQAFTQRGVLRRLIGDDKGALEDFKAAAKLGGDFAKQMCIVLNPYAAMCNQMLSEVFQKVQTGQA